MSTFTKLFYFLLGGITILLLIKLILPRITNILKNTTILIRSYWIVCILLFLIGISVNYITYKYLPKNGFITENLINFYTGLFFAIYTGYLAFNQYQNNRFEKITSQAENYFKQGDSFFERARRLFEEAYKINPNDDFLVSDYAELTMILGDWDLLNKLIIRLNKIKLEESVNITISYFRIGEQLIKEHNKDARTEIQKMLKYIDKNPSLFKSFNWRFGELKSSKIYKDLGGDCKKILDALINYLENKGDVQRTKLNELL